MEVGTGLGVDADELRDLLDERQIRRLLAAYADEVTRGEWSAFAELFTADAVVEVARGGGREVDGATGPEAIAAMVSGFVSRFDFLVQAPLNARIQLRVGGDVDRACARVVIGEYRQLRDGGRFLHSAGTYHDQYVREGGRWWFARRRYERIYASAPAQTAVGPRQGAFELPISGV